MLMFAQGISSDDGDNTVVSFLTSGSIVAIAADRKSKPFGLSKSSKLNVFVKMQNLMTVDIQLQKG